LAVFLAAVFRLGCFGSFGQRNRLLLLCDFDCFAKRSLNLGLVGTKSREKYTLEAMQFGTPPALFKFFDLLLRLGYCLESFGSPIREMQSFRL
jgi:hypothetical protein